MFASCSSETSAHTRYWSASELRGYAHMRQLQESTHDTVDDLDTTQMTTLQDFYEAILGPALRQSNVCGLLITGTRDMTSGQNCAMAWGTQSLAFPGYDEVWQVRSSPKGRMGKPIEPGELRKVAVLVRPSNTNGKAARITTIKLWVRLPVDVLRVSNQRQHGTYGAHGVNMIGIHLFEHHGRRMLSEKGYTQGRHNYRAVFGSFVSVTTAPPPGVALPEAFLNKHGDMITSVQSCPIHHLLIATSLLGNTLRTQPGGVNLPGTREERHERFEKRRTDTSSTMSELMVITEHACQSELRGTMGDDWEDPGVEALRVSEETMNWMRAEASGLMAMAEALCEQMSHCGFMDMSADPFFEQAMPDAMHRPCGMPLLIALAVRIACYPERVGLPFGKPDDQLATREACNLLESMQPAVLPHGVASEGSSCDTDPQYAMDIVIQHTVAKLLAELDKIREGGYITASSTSPARPPLSEKDLNKDIDVIENTIREALCMFYRTGLALCVDLLGTAPRRSDGTSGVYTRVGMAESCCDAVEHAKAELAYSNNLGRLAPRIDPMRATTRAAQQMALARTLLVVERWLCTGTYCNTRLVVNDEGEDTEIERVNVHAAASSTLSRCFSPASDEESRSTAHAVPTAEALTRNLESGIAVRTAGGSKKKMQRTMRQNERSMRQNAQRASDVSSKLKRMKIQEEEVVQKSMSSRSRRRASVDAQMVNEVLDSLAVRTRGGQVFEEAVQCLSPGSGKAIDDATQIFGDVLHCGACHGTTERINMQCFLVGRGSVNHCCNCNKPIHVVESLAFGGHHAACRTCRHPRCLDCVQHDIDLLSESKTVLQVGPLSDAVAYRTIENCLFCAKG